MLKADPDVDWVAELYVIFLRFVVPKIVFLLTVMRSWALWVAGKEHDPGGVNVLYANEDENVDEHVEHWPGSFFVEQVPHVEWQSWVITQLFPLSVYPWGQSETHFAVTVSGSL